MISEENLTIKPLPHMSPTTGIKGTIHKVSERFTLFKADDGAVYSMRYGLDLTSYNDMAAVRKLWCQLTGNTMHALNAAIKAKRERDANESRADDIAQLRANAKHYGFELVELQK